VLNTTEIAPEQARTSWGRYILSHPRDSDYHLMARRRVMEDAFGHATFTSWRPRNSLAAGRWRADKLT